MDDPLFLTLAEIINIHNNQIELYGGNPGIRDIGLLDSAISQPLASHDGAWLHQDIYEMAAAYTYHIAQDHPFIDGNKRTALASALVFLEFHGITILDPKGKLLDSVLAITNGKMGKKKFAEVFRQLPHE